MANSPDEESPQTPPRQARVDSVSTNVPVPGPVDLVSRLSVGVGAGTFLSMVSRTCNSRLKFNITTVLQLKPCFLMDSTASKRCNSLRIHTTSMTMEAYCPPVCKQDISHCFQSTVFSNSVTRLSRLKIPGSAGWQDPQDSEPAQYQRVRAVVIAFLALDACRNSLYVSNSALVF